MDTAKHRVKGAAERVVGRAKQTVGAAAADPDLQAEGAGQELVGHTRGKVARGVDRTKAKLNTAVGRANQRAAVRRTPGR